MVVCLLNIFFCSLYSRFFMVCGVESLTAYQAARQVYRFFSTSLALYLWFSRSLLLVLHSPPFGFTARFPHLCFNCSPSLLVTAQLLTRSVFPLSFTGIRCYSFCAPVLSLEYRISIFDEILLRTSVSVP